jgi:hypothetical protein
MWSIFIAKNVHFSSPNYTNFGIIFIWKITWSSALHTNLSLVMGGSLGTVQSTHYGFMMIPHVEPCSGDSEPIIASDIIRTMVEIFE